MENDELGTELDIAFDQFLDAMDDKLQKKAEAGATGWNDPKRLAGFKARLIDQVNENDWVDVANFAMFLWYAEQNKVEGG